MGGRLGREVWLNGDSTLVSTTVTPTESARTLERVAGTKNKGKRLSNFDTRSSTTTFSLSTTFSSKRLNPFVTPVPIAADKGAEPLLPVNAALAPAFKLGCCVMYVCVCGLCVCV